jgi:hypothetical protein
MILVTQIRGYKAYSYQIENIIQKGVDVKLKVRDRVRVLGYGSS